MKNPSLNIWTSLCEKRQEKRCQNQNLRELPKGCAFSRNLRAKLLQKGNTFHEKVTSLLQIQRKKLAFWNDPNLYKMLNLGHYVFKKSNFLDWPNFVQNAQSRAMLLQKGNTFHEKVTSFLQIQRKKLAFWNDPNLYKMLNLGQSCYKKATLFMKK